MRVVYSPQLVALPMLLLWGMYNTVPQLNGASVAHKHTCIRCLHLRCPRLPLCGHKAYGPKF